MGKVMILSFSNSEEHIVNRILDFLEKEKSEDVVEISAIKEIYLHNLIMYPEQRKIFRNNEEIQLTCSEYNLLLHLVRHPGIVYTKEQIFEAIYEDERTDNINNAVYCLISSLRRKLETDPKHPEHIQTVRGIGYKYGVYKNMPMQVH